VVKSEENDEDVSDVESIGDDEFDSLMSNYFKSTTPVDDSEEEEEDDDLASATKVDFASGLHDDRAGKKKGKRQKKEDSDSEQDEDDVEEEDFDDDDGDEFLDLGDDGGMAELTDEDGDDLDDDMFEADDEPMMMKKTTKKQRMSGSSSTFAPAEEFSEMLEDNAEDVLTGSHTFINKERADKKQMRWEANQIRKQGNMNFQKKPSSSGGKTKNKHFKRRKVGK